MSRISNLVSAACLAAACMSCETPEVITVRKPLVEENRAPPAGFETLASPLLDAIVVRDAYTVAVFARRAPDTKPPQTLTITFYVDHDPKKKVLEEIKAVVQESGSGFVYAVPQTRPTRATLTNIADADSATITIYSREYGIALGLADGNISELLSGAVYWQDYSPCPDCIIYFLCHCLEEVYGVDSPAGQCPPLDKRPCTAPEPFKPIPFTPVR